MAASLSSLANVSTLSHPFLAALASDPSGPRQHWPFPFSAFAFILLSRASGATRPTVFLLMGQRDTKGVSLALDDGLLLKLELFSDPKLLCVVRGALERLTEVFGFSPPDRRSVTRAVDEALTNIMRHCYNGRTDQPIEVYCRRVRPRASQSADGLEILLCDQGPAVDPSKLRGRRLDEIKPGGLGLHFIRQSMDTVEYQRADNTNQFRMVKYLQPSTQSRSS